MTRKEIYKDCSGYCFIDDDKLLIDYRKKYIHKKKNGKYLFPFKKTPVNNDIDYPTFYNSLYKKN